MTDKWIGLCCTRGVLVVVSLHELQTIILAAVFIIATGFLTKAGEAAWGWLRDEFTRRRRK
jgi:hypothetical protein